MGRRKGYRKPDEAYIKEYKQEIRMLSVMSMRQVALITGRSVNTLSKLKKYI